jgi:coenzyme F420-reducing hydrogenase delta subunit
MDKELIIKICDSLIDQLTILKGYMQLDKINNRIDHSIIITQEIEKLEKVVNELVNQLLEF